MGAFDSTIGVFFVGLLLSVALWGLSCCQAWNYFYNYSNDSRATKAVVCVCFLADTVHQALISHTLYTMVITSYGNPIELLFAPVSLLISVPFLGITGLFVQSYYVWRIWRLSSKSWAWSGPAGLLVLAKLGWNITYPIKSINVRLFSQWTIKMGSVVTAYVAFDVAADVYISAAVCWLLYSHKTAYRGTRSMINKLIFFTTTTGALTGLTAIALLVVHIAAPNSAFFFFFYFLLGRLFVNSLLASLNMRGYIRRTGNLNDVEFTPPAQWSSDQPGSTGSMGLAVKVNPSQLEALPDPMEGPKALYFHTMNGDSVGQGVYPMERIYESS